MNANRPPAAAPKVSVVVAVRDGWDDTFRLLLTLASQPCAVAREIIVVDDGSTDETPLGLPQLSGIVLHRNEEALGLVHAWNQGSALASGETLVFLGNDAAPEPGWIEPLLAALQADPGLAAVGPRLRDASGAPLGAGAESAWAASAGRPPPPELAGPTLGLGGLAVRTGAFRAVGGFDAAFRDAHAEVDLCWRLTAHGARLARVPEAVLKIREVAPMPEDDALLAARCEERFGPPARPAPAAAPPSADAETAAPDEAASPLRPVARPPFDAAPPAAPDARPLAVCAVIPDSDETYELELRLRDGDRLRGGKVRFTSTAPLREVAIPYLPPGWARAVTPGEILASISCGYDFEAASAEYRRAHPPGAPARVAFTVLHPNLMGGGTINLFRLVNWLTDLGAEVAVYSDQPPPRWVQVNARYHHIPDPAERYAAIEEPVVLVYSVQELPSLLRAVDRRGKRIFHLCQGAEEFHLGIDPPPPLLTPNGAFDLLNSLPVGRVVVSRHLERYFADKYGQRAWLIENGVDTSTFRPPDRRRVSPKNDFTILVSGDPHHPLKQIPTVKAALARLAARHPKWRLTLVNLCGFRASAPPAPAKGGFTYELRGGLTPVEVREALGEANVCVNSSWYEGFGLPSLEAMACDVPVVQTDNHGLDGVVQDGRDCLMVPPADPDALAAALENVLRDPDLRARLVAGGRDTVRRHGLERQREAAAAVFSELTGVALPVPPARPVVAASGERPRFSVLVPTYNQAQFLPAALDSLLAQTEPDWEALVVNDGSTDATAEVMARYARRDRRIRAFHQPNGGVASALDRGLEEARADWICWLSSDDLFLPEKLSVQREVIEADPSLRFLHTDFRVLLDESQRIVPSSVHPATFIPPTPEQVIRFLQVNYVNGISVAVHRAVFDRVGGFDPGYRCGQDFDLWLRASARYRSRFVPRATCVTRVHAAQGTAVFGEAGIYDSARAGAAFLARHRLEDLFPAVDLSQPAEAQQALVAALGVVFDPQAYLTACGLQALLVGRLQEWVAGLPGARRHALVAQTRKVLLGAGHQQLADLLATLGAVPPGFRFRAPDPVSLLERHVERLAQGGDSRLLGVARRYLERLAADRVRDPLARAS